MINRKSAIFFTAVLLSACFVMFPPCLHAEEEATIEGMVQIDRNHLYMISVGSSVGVEKGDVIEVHRMGVKVAEARTISVLPDSSMIEMTAFFNVTDIFESDTVYYTSRITAVPVKRTLSSAKKEAEEELGSDISIERRGQQKRGLLGSETSISRQVQIAREPLQKEVKGLKAGMETLKEDYEGKMDAVMTTVAGGSARAAINQEKKWRKKFEKTKKKHEEEISSLRNALELEYAREKADLEARIASLSAQMSDAGLEGDKRTQQLINDLESKENKVNLLRQTFERDRELEEGRWLEKIASLEQKYQNQLRIQKQDFDREFAYSNDKFLDEVTDLKGKIFALQTENKKQRDELDAQDKKWQKTVDSVKAEQFDLEEMISKKNAQIVKSKQDAIALKDDLAGTKTAYTERIKAAKQPLETKIKELKSELADLRKTYETKLSNEQEKSRSELAARVKQQAEKLDQVEAKYQLDANTYQATSKDKIKQLEGSLKAREDRINLLEKERKERVAKISQNEKELKQLIFNVQTLKGELKDAQDSRDNDISTATRSLEKETSRMKGEITSLVKEYEEQLKSLRDRSQEELAAVEEKAQLEIAEENRKLQKELSSNEKQWQARIRQLETKAAEDESLIAFLNKEMATLTNDVENRDKQIANYEKDLSQSEKELAQTKTTYADKIERATKPLQNKIKQLDGELAATKKTYDNQIKNLQQGLKDDLASNDQDWQAKLAFQKEENQKVIAQLNKQIAALRGDSDSAIAQLQDQLKEKENTIKSLESKTNALNSSLNERNSQVAKLEDNVAQIKNDQVSSEEQWLSRIAKTQDGYQQTIEDQKADYENKISELSKQISALQGNSDSAIAQLQDQLKEKENTIKSLESKTNALNSSLNERNSQVAKLEDNVAQIKNDQVSSEEQWLSRIAKTQDGYQQTIEDQKADYENKISELSKQISALQGNSDSAIAQLQDQLKDSKGQIGTLEKTNADLQANFKNKERQLSEFEDNIAQLNEDSTSSEAKWKERLALKEEERQRAIDELSKQISALQGNSDSAITQLQSQLKDRDGQIRSLEGKTKNLNSDLQKKSDLIAKLEDTIAGLNIDLKDTKLSHSEKVKYLKQPLESKIKQLTSELNLAKNTYDIQIKNLQQGLKDDLASNDQDWQAKLTSQNEENQKVIAQLNKQIAALRGDSDSAIAQLQDQLKDSKGQIGTLEKTNAGLQASFKNKERQLSEFEDNIAQLNEDRTSSEAKWKERLALKEEERQRAIDELSKQISALQGDSDSVISELRDKLKEKELLISDLDKKNNALNSEVKKKSDQLAKFEDNIAQLNSDFTETKKSQSEKIKFAKLPLEGKIQELTSELKSSKRGYEEKIKDLQSKSKDDQAVVDQQWKTKLASMENDHQKRIEAQKRDYENKITELDKLVNTLRNDSDGTIEDLQNTAQKREKKVVSLEKEVTGLGSDLMARDEQLAKLEDMIAGLRSENADSRSSLSKKIKLAKEPLEEKITQLNNEIESIQKKHEGAIEDIQREARNKLLDNEEESQKKYAEREVQWEDKMEQLRKQFREEIAVLGDQLNESRDGSDQRVKFLEEDLQKEKRNSANLKMEATNLQLDLSERDRQLAKAEDDIEDMKERLDDDTFATEKRIELAKESMRAEIEMLRSELAFAKENQADNVKFIQERAANDLAIAQERAKAELGASEAQWKVKWATREEEFRQEHNAAVEGLEKQLTGNRGELRETIADLNDRLSMLKNSSENQIKELEDELSQREYMLSLKDGEFQKRLTEVENQWAAKLSEEQKKHQKSLGQQKQGISEDFLDEKKELRETIVELTEQFQDLRDSSSQRIKELESDLDQRDYKLGFVENHSQQNTLEIEEKWQAKITAIEERYKGELADQKRDLQERFMTGKRMQQSMLDDLTGQIQSLREQYKMDLALKEEELESEIAVLKGKHQRELAELSNSSSRQGEELSEKVQFQKTLIDSLEREKSDLSFSLQQKERELTNSKAIMEDLKKETRMKELSQAEKLQLSRDSLQAKIDELSSQLAIEKARASEERMDIEDRWKMKLANAEEGFLEKLKTQRQSLESEINAATSRLDRSRDSLRNETAQLESELTENQTLIQLLSREKFDLSSELDMKNRENIRLNEEIIGLKENLEIYKNLQADSSSLSSAGRTFDTSSSTQTASLSDRVTADQKAATDQYYSVVRKAILSKFQEFDFSAYAGKEGVVKIDFELSSDGSPKSKPEFIGTNNENLKDLLLQCFEGAAPFPPFPKNLNKQSQRFALSVSFKK